MNKKYRENIKKFASSLCAILRERISASSVNLLLLKGLEWWNIDPAQS